MFRKREGIALIFAVFLLVVFSFIGVSLVVMLSTSSMSSSRELISTQVFFAAETGAELRIYETLISPDPPEGDKSYKIPPEISVITRLKRIAGLPGGKTLYEVKSTASKDTIKRQIKIKFWK